MSIYMLIFIYKYIYMYRDIYIYTVIKKISKFRFKFESLKVVSLKPMHIRS